MKAIARATEILLLTVTVSEVSSSVRKIQGGNVTEFGEYFENFTYKMTQNSKDI